MKFTKITILDGHYASGDWECFCFDTHIGPLVHENMLRRGADGDGSDDPEPDCRTYPTALIPDEARGRKGRWTITVEFEPEE